MLLLHPPIEPWARRTPGGLQVTLLVDAAAGEPQQVEARVLLDHEDRRVALRRGGRHGRWQGWHATLPWCGSQPNTRYVFRVRHGASSTWLGAAGARPRLPRLDEHFRAASAPVVPAWAPEQVVYQIFPDRFARGQAGPLQVPEVVHGSAPQPARARAWGEPLGPGEAATTFYGGDLAGIEHKLPWLQQLGATTLYLNPVFAAGSNHRYNTEDYTRVCPLLGGNEALASLAGALHARGMKLVLDAVLNHTGTNHPWFNQWGRHPEPGAAHSRSGAESRWHAWYARDAQGAVVGWNGHRSLPVLDYANPEVVAAMFTDPGSVLRRWLQPPVAADGWRLDAIHMLGEGTGARGNARLLQTLRRAARGERADAWLVGEHFGPADAWLQGDQEDAAMNYWGFTQPLWAWLAGRDVGGADGAAIDTAAFAAWLQEALAAVPYEVQLSQWNALDSHDVPRFVTMLGGDRARLEAAVTMQFAWAGVPVVYYGDEVGLEGGRDPDNRRCFPWDEARWDQRLLAHYRACAARRRGHAELRHGALQILASGEHWLGFARYTADALTVVAVARAGVDGPVALPLDALPMAAERLQWTGGPPDLRVEGNTVAAALPQAGAWVAHARAG